MRTSARPLLIACALAALSALRVIAFAQLDRRPLYGGWEAPDLQRAMFYHYGLHHHLDWTFAEQVARDAFKPPLWYGGIPLLFGWRDSLSVADFLYVNAACVAGMVLGAYLLGRRLGGDRAGVLAAAVCALLPGVAWRVGMVGVEPAHAALLVGAMLALVGLLQSARDAQGGQVALRGVVLGLCVGLGALMKWNFAAYVVPPAAVALVLAGAAAGRAAGGLAVGAAVAAALFGPWALGADLADVVSQGMTGEQGTETAAVFVRDLTRRSLGVVGWAMLAASLLGAVAGPRLPPPPPRLLHAPHPRSEALVLAVAIGALVALHVAIPHKETRYLLPALPLLAVGLATPASRLLDAGWGRAVLVGVLVLGAAQSWVVPWFVQPPQEHAWSDVLPAPIDDDYDILAVLAHPSLRARERTVVTTSLREQARFPVLTFLDWELYGRNPNPVLSRSDWPDVTSKACAFDLERSTHFLTNRDLDIHEESALRSMGFERVVTVAPRVADVGTLSLWALESRSTPRYR
jgi:hypothetical protein